MNRHITIVCLMSIGSAVAFDWPINTHFTRSAAARAYAAHDYPAAQQDYETLIVDSPNDFQALLGLANTFYAQKQFAVADCYYKLCDQRAQGAEQREQIWFNRGCAQAQQQLYKEALASFEGVVHINPHNTRAQKNIEILKKQLQQPKKQDPSRNNQQQNKNTKQDQDRNGQQADSNDKKGQRNDTAQNKQHNGDGLQNARDARGGQQQDQTAKADQAKQAGSTHNTPSPLSTKSNNMQNQHTTKQLPGRQMALLKQAQDIENEARGIYVRHATQRRDRQGASHGW